MSIDVGRALRDGADDLLSARGAILYVVFAASALASLPIYQTLTRELTDRLIALEAIQEWAASLDTTAEELFDVATPLALDVGLPVLLVGLVGSFVLAEVIHLVAIRAFASEADAAIPTDEVTANLGSRLLVLLVASLLVQVLVFTGIAVFVLPGVIAAFFVVFVRQAILLDDAGVLASLRTSVSLVADDFLSVLALLVMLIVVGFLVGLPTLFVPVDTVLYPVLSAILGAVSTTYGVASVTRAYQMARDGPDGPPGPDDLDQEFADEDF